MPFETERGAGRAAMPEPEISQEAARAMLAALVQARVSLAITRSNIRTEMTRGRYYQWVGVPEEIALRVREIEDAIALAERGA
jgi:hypothetical protein